MSKPPQFAADTLLGLLANKHREDVFVPECKDGPSQGTMSRLDAWAMAKSWARPLVSGYEIKVARKDFMQDKKWPSYLPMCNELYFVCPRDVIKPEECPAPCGLLYVADSGTRLFTKKKAPYRDVTIPETVFRYVLMCRARIENSEFGMRTQTRTDRVEFWRKWAAERAEAKRLGYGISHKIAMHVDMVEREIEDLRTKHKNYEEIRQVLKDMGYGTGGDQWITGEKFRQRLVMMHNQLPDALRTSLRQLQSSVTGILNTIDALDKKIMETPHANT